MFDILEGYFPLFYYNYNYMLREHLTHFIVLSANQIICIFTNHIPVP